MILRGWQVPALLAFATWVAAVSVTAWSSGSEAGHWVFRATYGATLILLLVAWRMRVRQERADAASAEAARRPGDTPRVFVADR